MKDLSSFGLLAGESLMMVLAGDSHMIVFMAVFSVLKIHLRITAIIISPLKFLKSVHQLPQNVLLLGISQFIS